jgi:hypothetical protein
MRVARKYYNKTSLTRELRRGIFGRSVEWYSKNAESPLMNEELAPGRFDNALHRRFMRRWEGGYRER